MINEAKNLNKHVKFIFVTGGVVSSLGKGIITATTALLLKEMGYKTKCVKCDPYLNTDPGTMNPSQHGEVFVTDDGAETDLDLGHYERFSGIRTNKNSTITSGKIYTDILSKERRGDFLGKTVQTIPHVTDAIKDYIYKNLDDDLDFLLCEIGGTVGDMEALPFLEAIRQIGYECGHARTLYMHMTLVPYLKAAGELKTKPTQHSVRELRSLGIVPGILLCRSEKHISLDLRSKIGLFCNMTTETVIPAEDSDNLYEIPLKMSGHGFDDVICNYFQLPHPLSSYLDNWRALIKKMHSPSSSVNIAIIAKYTDIIDSYKSLIEALKHAGIQNECSVLYKIIDSRDLEYDNVNLKEVLKEFHGIIVPGGFGNSGILGKIRAIQYARENNVPMFGICLGMQLIVIEAARNLLGLKCANSTEFDPGTKDPVVLKISEWFDKNNIKQDRKNCTDLGGTMRLGSYDCKIEDESSLAFRIYAQHVVSERHRHRYEINNDYIDQLEKIGLRFTGVSTKEKLMEMVEIPGNGWFLGVQSHPELKSTIACGHPIFNNFVMYIKDNKKIL